MAGWGFIVVAVVGVSVAAVLLVCGGSRAERRAERDEMSSGGWWIDVRVRSADAARATTLLDGAFAPALLFDRPCGRLEREHEISLRDVDAARVVAVLCSRGIGVRSLRTRSVRVRQTLPDGP